VCADGVCFILWGAAGCTILVVVAASFGLAIGEIVVANKFGDDVCVGNYHGISFSYKTWLLVSGWVNIATFCALAALGGCYLVAASAQGTVAQGAIGAAGACLMWLFGMYSLAWYIVGAVLFFKEIEPSCQSGKPLYDFGLALFILQTIGICCGACNKNARSTNDMAASAV